MFFDTPRDGERPSVAASKSDVAEGEPRTTETEWAYEAPQTETHVRRRNVDPARQLRTCTYSTSQVSPLAQKGTYEKC